MLAACQGPAAARGGVVTGRYLSRLMASLYRRNHPLPVSHLKGIIQACWSAAAQRPWAATSSGVTPVASSSAPPTTPAVIADGPSQDTRSTRGVSTQNAVRSMEQDQTGSFQIKIIEPVPVRLNPRENQVKRIILRNEV